MSSLMHHGVKGQRWGVRRFQNKDGTRTAAGKKQDKLKRLKKTSKDYASIKESLSDDDLKFLNYDDDDIKRARELGTLGRDLVDSGRVAHRVIQKDKNGTPVTYVDANWMLTTSLLTGKNTTKLISIDLATRAGEEYRGKGYAVAAGKKMVKWFDTYGYKDYEYMEWGAKEKNIASQKTAEKLGFKKYEGTTAPGWTIYTYEHKAKHTSIVGTMYIEDNALILGDSSYLEHHGIRGQRWGVRRFQNKDGTLTREGQIRFAKKNLKHAKVRNLEKWGKSPDSNVLYIIGTSGSGKSTTAKGLADDGDQVIHLDTIFEKENHGSADSNKDFEKFLKDNNVDISKASDFSLPKEERWKTYDAIGNLVEAYGQQCYTKGSKVVIEGVQMGDQTLYPDKNYFNGKPTVVLKGNIVRDTFRADRRDGVPLRKTVARLTDKERWEWYKQVNATSNEIKYTSIGGTMYIEGNALILGDSSYLEHHGIRGQRWGVRRFQNRDGSLTNAGRKRLGYATKGAAQAVGKAFKAGVKAGGNAVKAAKAHHEKKEAEKLQKKKEKASKTRLGVMANKDLFTNEEIRKLNERFKLEDEMKMATLQKGVEIAKAVGTIAQNVGTVAKTYEDVTGQSLSPIKRKAAEEKARQDAEDRKRKIEREDAEEARKVAKEERAIELHKEILRKNIADADTQEFTAQKTKAEADSAIIKALSEGKKFSGKYGEDADTDATGQSWMEKATAGGKNPFFEEMLKNDPELAAAKADHDAKAEWKQHEQERDARIAAREKEAIAKQSQPQQKQGGGDDDALFSQKGSLPIDKDRYRNNRAMEKAKQVKEDAAEERAKKQDEKAVNQTIDDTIEANRSFKETVRAQDPHAYDRGIAKDYIKGKLNNLPNTLADLNPINRAAKKIADKAAREEEAQVRKSMKDQYDQMVKSDGRDEANYVMYQTRVANLQQQGYSERKAKQIADSNPTFSAKRNRKKEYYEKTGELESTHKKNAKEIRKANKELTDYYYKLINGPGYDPGTPKREALDRKYKQKRGELERLDKDNNEMLEKGMKEAKKILEHSLSIQNGVLFVNAGEPYLEHHGVKGMKWGKHLMAGKGEAGAGGGSGEDDEKLKEMAKKAGMSVAEYRTKMAGKLSGAASKVGEKVYDAAGGKYKKEARELYKAASREDRVAEEWKREQSALRGSANRKREAAKAWDNEAKSAASAAKTANNVAIKAGSMAKAYSERAKARKEAAAKAKVPKMSGDPNTPNPFGSTGVREQDDKINSWADDINRNNKMTRSGWKRKMNYEQPKKEFEKAAQDMHNGKKIITLSEGAAAYALAREQQAVRRRRHSATIGSGDEKKAKELNGIKREMEESGAIARRAQQSAKKNRDRLNDSARMDASSAHTSGLLASNHNKYGRRKRADAKEAQSKYEKSLAGKYDRLKAKRNKKSVKKKANRLRKARHLLPKLKHFDDTNAIYTEGTRLVINSKWG